MTYLHIKVLKGKDIPKELWEESNPYVRLRYGAQEATSRVDHEGGAHPTFNEDFTFTLLDPPGKLEVAIYSRESFPLQDHSFDDFLAMGILNLGELLKDGKHHGWLHLSNHSGAKHGILEMEIHTD